MRMGIALQEIERSALCRESAHWESRDQRLSRSKGSHTEVGKAVLTYLRQGLPGKRMTGTQVLGFDSLFPW